MLGSDGLWFLLVSFLIIPFSSLSCIFSHTLIMIFLFVQQFLIGALFDHLLQHFGATLWFIKGWPSQPFFLLRSLLHALSSWICFGDQPLTQALRPCSFHDSSDSLRLILICWHGSLVLCLGPSREISRAALLCLFLHLSLRMLFIGCLGVSLSVIVYLRSFLSSVPSCLYHLVSNQSAVLFSTAPSS